MKKGHLVYSQHPDEGLTKGQYVFTELVKALIVPGKNYTEPEIQILLNTSKNICDIIFEK